MPVAPSFLRDNLIEPNKRLQIIITIVLALVATAAVVGVVWLRERDDLGEGLEWLVKLISPLAVLPVALPLFRRDFATPPEAAVLLAAVVLVTERLTRYSVEAWRSRPRGQQLTAAEHGLITRFFEKPRLVMAVVLVLTAAQAFYIALFSVWSHQRFGTFGFDLGQYDQIFNTSLAGQPLRQPTLGWDTVWGGLHGHADFGVLVMMPIYAIYPRAETLLVMQATLVASAAIPLFTIARRHLPQWLAFLLAVAWLGFPPLHGAQLYDIHMQPFGMSFAMWAMAALDAKKWVAFWLLALMATLCREDVSIGLVTAGIFLTLSGYRPRTGVAMIVVFFSYFLLVRFAIMPSIPGWTFADVWKELYPTGEKGYGPVVKTMVSNPAFLARSLITWEKLRYLLQMFAPLAFLPLRRPSSYIMLAPGALLTWFSTAYAPTISISFQYVCNWTAYAFIASVIVLQRYGDDERGTIRRIAAAIALVVGITLSNQQWGAWQPNPVLHGGFQMVPLQAPTEADRQRHRDLEDLVKSIPEDASLCAADKSQPHVTWHLSTWSLRDGLYDCQYLVFTNLPGDLGNDRGQTAIATGEYEVVETRRGVTLARKRSP